MRSLWILPLVGAMAALSKWKFEPATLNGAPVDVIFHLAINFKTN